ncbi:ketopantoate reductase family protein [Salinicola sp. NYA28a]|jgi:2-dehydropantoate 2-reductase
MTIRPEHAGPELARPATSPDGGPWLIVGAGALGQLFAAALAPTNPVILLGRRPAPPAIRLRTLEGRDLRIALRRAQVSDWANRPSGNEAPALVVLATKSHDAQAALDALAPRLAPATPLLLLQNGFRSQPDITECWSGPVLCASTTEAAYRHEPDPAGLLPDVVHAATGKTWIGDLADRHLALAANVAERLTRAGITAAPCRDIRQRLWQKLAINAVINPLTASHRVRNGELAGPRFRPWIVALVAEIAQIMQAEDVLPPDAGWQALVDGVIETTAANRSSMLQDVLAGRPTERDAILRPLIEAGRRHGLDVATIDALYRTTPH